MIKFIRYFALSAVIIVNGFNKSKAMELLEQDENFNSSSFEIPIISSEDLTRFKLIQSAKNFVLETNADFDEIQLLLKAPIRAELGFENICIFAILVMMTIGG